MIKIDDKYINVEVSMIIDILKTYLEERGVYRFKDMKSTADNLMVTCPFHKEGNENRPSFGILRVNKSKPAGTCHCFTCGYNSTLEEMISNVLGVDDKGEVGAKWLISNFAAFDKIEYESPLKYLFEEKEKPEEIKYIKEEELEKYRYYHPYMWKRKLTEDIVNLFDIGYDDHYELKDKQGNIKGVIKCITFPVRDEFGRCVFIARRGVESKFFHYPTNVKKPVYLLDHIIKNKIEEVYVCESSINALTLWTWGLPAVALLGTGSATQYDILNKTDIKSFILCFDGDEAGEEGEKKFIQYIKNKFIYTVKIPKGKDVNDLSKEEFSQIEKILK